VDSSVVFIPPTPTGGNKDTLNAVIDGNLFNSTLVEISIDSTSRQLTIAGLTPDGRNVALIMPFDITPGTYNLDFTTGQYIGIYGQNAMANMYSQANGSLTIVTNDSGKRRITGTFSFIASPLTSGTPATITQGYFAVNY